MRARDMTHLHELLKMGIKDIERETFNSALSMGEKVLLALGFHPHQARKRAKIFHQYDLEVIQKMHHLWDDRSAYVSSAKQAREELGRIFAEDQRNLQHGGADSAWVVK
ncbi:hypothetical protein EBR21_14315 [bacterium]|nr:hypothetical protein [bacterium]